MLLEKDGADSLARVLVNPMHPIPWAWICRSASGVLRDVPWRVCPGYRVLRSGAVPVLVRIVHGVRLERIAEVRVCLAQLSVRVDLGVNRLLSRPCGLGRADLAMVFLHIPFVAHLESVL